MSEQFTAKITHIDEKVRERDTDFGKYYYLTIKLDNDHEGSLGVKDPKKLRVGDSLTYTFTENQYGKTFKRVNTSSFGGRGGTSVTIDTKAETALKTATSLFIARNPEGCRDKKVNEVVSGIQQIAELHLSWLEAKSKK